MPHCLIADDSKIMRMLLRKIMENFGFEVSEAEDGEDVLEQCLSVRPDIIISDWSLPLIDGIDVLYKIRADRKIKQPRFMFCSYVTDAAIIRQALAAPMILSCGRLTRILLPENWLSWECCRGTQ